MFIGSVIVAHSRVDFADSQMVPPIRTCRIFVCSSRRCVLMLGGDSVEKRERNNGSTVKKRNVFSAIRTRLSHVACN